MDIRQELFNNQDLKYKDFHKKLIPCVDEEKIIGVRLPVLKKLAKQAVKENYDVTPYYYEEFMIKGLMIGASKLTIDEYKEKLDEFVPFIDNWAVCDCCCASFKFAKKYPCEMWEYVCEYTKSTKEYELRFAIVMLMSYYLTDEYIHRVLNIIKSIDSEYYYVNMAIAWALSIAYVKYPELVSNIIESGELSLWVHNKTISKICDSYRVSLENKNYLKTLRIK